MTFRAVTFNCGGGNPAVADNWPQMMKLPFYRDVLTGVSDAAILALQEVTPPHAGTLRDWERDGAFTLIHASRPGQGNALLIPRRFEVVERSARLMWAANLRAARRAFRDRRSVPARQLGELRLWVRADIVDTQTGASMTVFCTHLSGSPWVRFDQAIALFDHVIPQTNGPVLLLGDLNIPPQGGTEVDIAIRSWLLPPLVNLAEACPSIDWIAGCLINPVRCLLHTDIGLSDHYPLEALLRLAPVGSVSEVTQLSERRAQ